MKANKEYLYQHVDFLTALTPARNHANLATLEQTCAYIETEFKRAGAQPVRQTWTAGGHEYSNIITSYNTGKTRRLIVGAHYDVDGDQPGADDNASAVAGLIETVRMVFEAQPQLDYRIDFVAYCLEEAPYFRTGNMGSYIHAQSLHHQGAEVLGMICYEMIGYFSDEPESQAFPSPELAALYPHIANFIIVVGIAAYADFAYKLHRLMAEGSGIDVQVIVFPDGEGLAGLSDQRNYWKFGYPAAMINDTAFVRNPHYHQKTDTIDTLNFDKMTEVVNSAYRAVTGM
jgi:Zn-dependent M28 family amino/carboxypeptidase